jgi:uncharacterized protein YjdB
MKTPQFRHRHTRTLALALALWIGLSLFPAAEPAFAAVPGNVSGEKDSAPLELTDDSVTFYPDNTPTVEDADGNPIPNPSYDSSLPTPSFIAARSAYVTPQGEDAVGWIYVAAAAASAARANLNPESMRAALSGKREDRSAVAAYLMNETSVGGVAYIPDVYWNDTLRPAYNSRIYEALGEYETVVASFYYNDEYFAGYEVPVSPTPGAPLPEAQNFLGDTYTYASSAAPNETVLIVGCDADGWLVRSARAEAREYTVSYSTPLYGAYAVADAAGADYDLTYQSDTDAATPNSLNKSYSWYANVFTTTSSNQTLEAVSFFVGAEGTDVSVSLVTGLTDEDIKNKLKGVNMDSGDNLLPTASIAYNLPGYYTVPVASGVDLGSIGSKFAIVVQTDKKVVPLTGKSGTGFVFDNEGANYTDGAAWTAATSAPSIKAHVKKSTTLTIQDITLAGVEGKTIELTHGEKLTLKPSLDPIDAPATEGAIWVYAIKDPATGTFREITTYTQNNSTVDIESPDPTNFTLSSAGVLTSMRKNEDEVKDDEDVVIAYRDTTEITVSYATKDDNGNITYVKTTDPWTVNIIKPEVEKLTLNKTSLTVNTNAKATLTAKLEPTNVYDKTLNWYVFGYKESVMNGKKAYTVEDFPAEMGAPVRVADGTITGIHPFPSDKYPGIDKVFVYAVAAADTTSGLALGEIPDESAKPDFSYCDVTVKEVALKGISVSPAKLTVMLGTVTPLNAKPSPATGYAPDGVQYVLDSTNKGPDGGLRIDSEKREIEAVKPGVYIVKCTVGGYSKLLTVTVADALNATLKPGGSKSFKLTGAESKLYVKWTFTDNENNILDFKKAPAGAASASVTGRTESTGHVTLTAEQYDLPLKDANGKVTTDADVTADKLLRRQTFILACAVPLKKIEIQDPDAGVKYKKLTLGVNEGGANPQWAQLQVASVGGIGTELEWVWSIAEKKNKPALLEFCDADGTRIDAPLSETDAKQVYVKPTGAGYGSAKVTAMNLNNNKKVSFNVKILYHPTSLTFKKQFPTVAIGKRLSLSTQFNPSKNVNKELVWTVTNLDGTPTDIATIADPKKGKVEVHKAGEVKVTATGSGGGEIGSAPAADSAPGAFSVSQKIQCFVPIKKLESSAGKKLTVGGSSTVYATAKTASEQLEVTWTCNGPSQAISDSKFDSFTFTPTAAGQYEIIGTTADGKSKKMKITVKAAG